MSANFIFKEKINKYIKKINKDTWLRRSNLDDCLVKTVTILDHIKQ